MKSISLFTGLAGIPLSDVYPTTHLTTGYPTNVKSSITKKIKQIIKTVKPSAIKIGKTGCYNSRRNGTVYKDFDEMYILYKSTNKKFVEEIESYYNNYTKENYPKLCVNTKVGSAGKMTDSTGFYYVYLTLVY